MAVFKCTGVNRLDGEGNPYCTFEAPQPWSGACPGCGRFYNWVKFGVEKTAVSKLASAGDAADVKVEYLKTGVEMFDHTIGGGLVRGSVVLFAGIHGGGKTTVLFEVCDGLTDKHGGYALYVTSEESVERVQIICKRLGIITDKIKILSTKSIHEVHEVADELNPVVIVYDSLQNFSLGESGATAHELVDIARLISERTHIKKCCSIVINQMAKDLSAKGSTDVPHLVETELYLYRFDADEDRRAVHALLDRDTRLAIRKGDVDAEKLRILICNKNRNGEERRKAFFLMTADGLIQPLDEDFRAKLRVRGEEDPDED